MIFSRKKTPESGMVLQAEEEWIRVIIVSEDSCLCPRSLLPYSEEIRIRPLFCETVIKLMFPQVVQFQVCLGHLAFFKLNFFFLSIQGVRIMQLGSDVDTD